MRILAAYLLAVLGGNPNPDKATIKKILSATKPPISAPDDRIDQLLKELAGKDLDQLIEEGKKKIGSAPAGGGGGGAPAAAGGAGKAADKKEEAPKAAEPEPEEEEVGMAGLFD